MMTCRKMKKTKKGSSHNSIVLSSAAGLVKTGKSFSPSFWDDYDAPPDSEAAMRAALDEDRKSR